MFTNVYRDNSYRVLPNPLKYLYTEWHETAPGRSVEMAWFGDRSVSSVPLCWMEAAKWRDLGRPYKISVRIL